MTVKMFIAIAHIISFKPIVAMIHGIVFVLMKITLSLQPVDDF